MIMQTTQIYHALSPNEPVSENQKASLKTWCKLDSEVTLTATLKQLHSTILKHIRGLMSRQETNPCFHFQHVRLPNGLPKKPSGNTFRMLLES